MLPRNVFVQEGHPAMLFRARALRRVNGMGEEEKKNGEKNPSNILPSGIFTDNGRTQKGRPAV